MARGQGQVDGAIFIVEVRREHDGARVLVRAAQSPAVTVFTSAQALWACLAGDPPGAAPPQPLPER